MEKSVMETQNYLDTTQMSVKWLSLPYWKPYYTLYKLPLEVKKHNKSFEELKHRFWACTEFWKTLSYFNP